MKDNKKLKVILILSIILCLLLFCYILFAGIIVGIYFANNLGNKSRNEIAAWVKVLTYPDLYIPPLRWTHKVGFNMVFSRVCMPILDKEQLYDRVLISVHWWHLEKPYNS